jgi:hypothetical protein
VHSKRTNVKANAAAFVILLHTAASVAPEWTSPLCGTTSDSNSGNDSTSTPLSKVQQHALSGHGIYMQTPGSDTRDIAVAVGNVRLDMHEDSISNGYDNNDDNNDGGNNASACAANNASNSSEYSSNVASYRLCQVS